MEDLFLQASLKISVVFPNKYPFMNFDEASQGTSQFIRDLAVSLHFTLALKG